MTTVMAPETRFKEVYLYTGNVLHILDTKAPVVPGIDTQRQPSLCNIRPFWPGIWWEDDVDLPTCLRCEAIKGAEISDAAS